MSRSKIKVYIVLHLLLFLYAAGGICSKLAAKEAFLSPKFIMYYMIVLANLAFYAIVWQQIIKRISLVSAFANKAITVVWGMMWGFLIFGESITITKIIGAVIIIVGIYFVVSDNEVNTNEH
ncbi:transporter [Lachnospiraceae bacterium BX3]|uniref:Transporter n=2 Tax=Jutongia hominis TaxID=2763664 RepID=A0ABR7MVD0_9FIRM|nr:transporter [Jutongia hominis]PWL67644.1 MAG: transporter [Clostridiaceae bacterium]PWL68392.1 MAG: transporter [Clostridiaceae bacterium]